MTRDDKIPAIPHTFFKWYCRKDRYEEIHGDLEELFYQRIEKNGLAKARLNYALDVIRCCQPYAWKKVNELSPANIPTMLKNHITISWRNIRKHAFYSFINVAGLASAMAACLIIVLFIQDELSYDKYNQKADRIYRIDADARIGENQFRITQRSAPEARAMVDEFPEVESAVRFRNHGPYLVKAPESNESYKEHRVIWTDSSFFDIFSVQVLEGNPATALTKPGSIAISKSTADKYFHGSTAIGRSLMLNNAYLATVTAVYKDIPAASHFHFDILIAMVGNWPVAREAQSTSFASENFTTYLLLAEGTDASKLEKKFPGFLDRHLGKDFVKEYGTDFTMDKFRANGNHYTITLRPLTSIHLHSRLAGEFESNGSITMVYMFGLIAILILLIACVNFTNLSMARSLARAKEVSVRKVIGSLRSQIVGQFLTESVLLTVTASVFAIFIAYFFIPAFNEISQKSLALPFADPGFYAILPGIAILLGAAVGIYPSAVLSALKPSQGLKGLFPEKMNNKSVRETLVVVQFVISIFLIIATITINRQMDFIRNKKLGFKKDQVLVLHDAYALRPNVQTFKNQVLGMASIEQGTVTGYLPVENGSTVRNNSVFWRAGNAENKVVFQRWLVDKDYVKTLQMRIKTGRDFSRNFRSDSAAVILNEKAAAMLGLAPDPVGRKITRSVGNDHEVTETYTVIGVVEDFHYASMEKEIQPLGLFLSDNDQSMSFLFRPDNPHELISSIETLWKKMAPGQPFKYSFLDQDFEASFGSEKRLSRLFVIFTSLAIIIACLGLFALTSFAVQKRTREIAIRKLMGASVAGIVFLLSKDFGKLIAIAFLIAAPMSIYVATRWLENYVYRTNIGIYTCLVAAAITFTIALFTMCFHSLKAAWANPVKSIKSE